MAFFVSFDDPDPTAGALGSADDGTQALSAAAFAPSALERATQRTIAAYTRAADDDEARHDQDGAAVRLAWLKQQLLAAHSSVAEGDLGALDALPPSLTAALAAVAGRARGQHEHNAELLLEARRSHAEADRLLQERGAMQDRVAAAEADRAAADSLLASLRAEHKEQERRWGEEKAELQLRLTRLAWKDATIKAQLKRKDAEYERLQKQLKLPPASASSAVVGGRERKGGVKSIEITATKLLPASVASLSGASAGGDEAGRLALAGADKRQAALLGENAELRETLRCLYAEVRGLEQRFDELLEEVEASRARARGELEAALAAAVCAAEGAAAAAAQQQASALGDAGAEAAAMAGLKEKGERGEFDPTTFQMPEEWLVRVVGEELRAEMAELEARFEALGSLLREKEQPSAAEEDGEGQQQGDDAAAEAAREAQRRLQQEVARLRARLASTEAVVRQQDEVIRTALFEEPARGVGGTPMSAQRGVGPAAQRRRLSDAWAAEEREGRARATAALEAEQGALFAAAESLKAQLDVDAWLKGVDSGMGAGSSSTAGTPNQEEKKKKATTPALAAAAAVKRTPLRALSSPANKAAVTNSSPTAAALLSPLLKARSDLEAIKNASASASKPSKQVEESPSAVVARAAIKGLAGAMVEMKEEGPTLLGLQEALGFLSPIKRAEE